MRIQKIVVWAQPLLKGKKKKNEYTMQHLMAGAGDFQREDWLGKNNSDTRKPRHMRTHTHAHTQTQTPGRGIDKKDLGRKCVGGSKEWV